MMRRTALRSRTPLATRSGLQRAAGLTPSRPLERRVPVRQVSAKRARDNRLRRKLADLIFGCERPPCAWPHCPALADDLHEVLPRARGGSITDPSIWAPLCRPHHDRATREDPEAYGAGLLFNSWDAARAVRSGVLTGWRTTDGGFVPEAPAAGGGRVA